MQDDKRNATVAREHLGSALEELMVAQGNPEVSAAQAAVARAVDHLNLVVRRLETERAKTGRDAHGQAVERAYEAARQALQSCHGARNNWDGAAHMLEPARQQLVVAQQSLDAACEPPLPEEARRA